MAKIIFDDQSYIECKKSDTPGKIVIIISAKDHENKLKRISNAVEITTEEYNKLVADI